MQQDSEYIDERTLGATGQSKRRRIANACETCKRRKERCNGAEPCSRCVERGFERECHFGPPRRLGSTASSSKRRRSTIINDRVATLTTASTPATTSPSSGSLPANDASSNRVDQSRLIRDPKGRYMYIGDSASLSFLQIIRRVVHDCIGPCSFVDDPLRHNIVEVSPRGQPDWLNVVLQQTPPRVSLLEAQKLIRRYHVATNGVLDLNDEAKVLQYLPACVSGRWTESQIPSPIYFLVLATGAQASPEDRDELAERLFAHGRFLTAQMFMEDASMVTAQAYTLITMYLLGACRRNAAFMQFGIAVRAAHALGLHRKDVASSFSDEESISRERLWKSIRVLDIFMSASLGRPLSTSESRDTETAEPYSASMDLCVIFERILTDVYSRRRISTEALSNIGAHHRRWSSRYFRVLNENELELSTVFDESLPNLGIMHLKVGYYYSIILLTRPFLTESITLHARTSKPSVNKPSKPFMPLGSNKVLIHACVDSAIRTIDLLRPLLDHSSQLPKRLPFINISLFFAALVLGSAHFGDLYQSFPLEQNLRTAWELLSQFTRDPIAQRNAEIIGHLRDACKIHIERCKAHTMQVQSRAVGSMFGQIHCQQQNSQASTQPQTRSPSSGGENSDADEIADIVHAGVHNTPAQRAGYGDPQMYPGLPGSVPTPAASMPGEYQYAVGSDVLDPTNVMYPPEMTPRTLWFDSLDETMPLFTTISNTNYNDPFASLGGYNDVSLAGSAIFI